jgi:hypothetical protein
VRQANRRKKKAFGSSFFVGTASTDTGKCTKCRAQLKHVLTFDVSLNCAETGEEEENVVEVSAPFSDILCPIFPVFCFATRVEEELDNKRLSQRVQNVQHHVILMKSLPARIALLLFAVLAPSFVVFFPQERAHSRVSRGLIDPPHSRWLNYCLLLLLSPVE